MMRRPPLITGVFYFMEEKKYLFVRRATEKDYDLRKSRIQKSKIQTDFTLLQKHSTEIIGIHNEYYYKKLNSYIEPAKLRHDQRINEFNNRLDSYNKIVETINQGIKPSLKCNCKGDLKHNIFETYEFIGCDNFRDKTFEHFKLYKPKFYGNEDFDFDFYIDQFKVSKNYLSDIVKELPFKVKASDLYEFLILNNVKLHRDDITRDFFYTAKNSRELSNKREQLILGQLQKKYKKIERHIVIAYQLSSENFVRFAIPDIIAFDKKDIIIFEQKKSIDNINTLQTDLYLELIKEMVDDSYNVQVKYIIEEEEYVPIPDFINYHEILTLKQL